MSAADRVETLRLHHRVQVIDGATGEPFTRVAAALASDEWPHWVLKTTRGGDVVLSTYDHLAGDMPATTTVEVRIDDPVVALRYGAGESPIQVQLQQGVESPAPVVLDPVPAPLEVRLRTGTGQPSSGHTVKAVYTAPPNSGDTDDEVTLAEQSPGVYACDPRAWRPRPYSIEIATQAVRTFLIDHTQPVTRLQFKYP